MCYRGRVHATEPFRSQRLAHDVWAATSSVALIGVWQLDKTRKPRMCRFPSLFRDFIVMMSWCYVTHYQETLKSYDRYNFILINKTVTKLNVVYPSTQQSFSFFSYFFLFSFFRILNFLSLFIICTRYRIFTFEYFTHKRNMTNALTSIITGY